jgi:hypothetical protein
VRSVLHAAGPHRSAMWVNPQKPQGPDTPAFRVSAKLTSPGVRQYILLMLGQKVYVRTAAVCNPATAASSDVMRQHEWVLFGHDHSNVTIMLTVV